MVDPVCCLCIYNILYTHLLSIHIIICVICIKFSNHSSFHTIEIICVQLDNRLIHNWRCVCWKCWFSIAMTSYAQDGDGNYIVYILLSDIKCRWERLKVMFCAPKSNKYVYILFTYTHLHSYQSTLNKFAYNEKISNLWLILFLVSSPHFPIAFPFIATDTILWCNRQIYTSLTTARWYMA